MNPFTHSFQITTDKNETFDVMIKVYVGKISPMVGEGEKDLVEWEVYSIRKDGKEVISNDEMIRLMENYWKENEFKVVEAAKYINPEDHEQI